LTETSPRRLLLVAEIERLPHGFLVARSAHPSEWEIENVVVAEPARRHGLGAALVEAFLGRVRAEKQTESGVWGIYLEVRESNLAARRLYEKCGFVIDRRREGYYSHPDESAILYHLLFQ
jgi:ribosomal-protein-alanine N-acetyltransferase